MASKYQSLIDRCNELYNQRVEVQFYQPKKQILSGRVVGWCFDEDSEDEPSVVVKFDPSDYFGGKDWEDYATLDRIKVVALTA